MKPRVFLVKCLGEEHKIILLPNGQLHLQEHNYKAELLAVRMGGILPPCCVILKRVKERYNWLADYDEINRFASDLNEIRSSRKEVSKHIEPLSVSISDRHAEKLLPRLEYYLKTTRYKRQGDVIINSFQLSVGAPSIWEIPQCSYCNCCCQCCDTCYYNACGPFQLGVRIDWEWQKVLNRGIPVVDGNIVLKILSEDSESIEVLAGRQEADLSIAPRRAIVRKGNPPQLVWLPFS